MLKCWNSDPNERPSFSTLTKSISGFAEMTAGYLDVSNYNPFEANVSKCYSSVGVPLDNPPVEINVQCPSEDKSLHNGSLL